MHPTPTRWLHSLLAAGALLAAGDAHAAGILTPCGATEQPIRIVDHHVAVVLTNGFAQTTVQQTFLNPNAVDCEAVYSFPLPKSASLSELTISLAEAELRSEVVASEEARAIYEQERDQGNDAGLAEKDGFREFTFDVTPVRAGGQAKIRFVYYQPIEIDTGVGRYLYPLRDGGTGEAAAAAFWTANPQVEAGFTFDLELKSEWPVDQIRLPGFENDVQVQQVGDGQFRVHLEQPSFTLDRDLVIYYRLKDGLPGRVELVAYKPAPDESGTFMMVLTPGVDLKPIDRGADYVFVLDVSGSMDPKLSVLARAMERSLGQMKGGDRFRIVTFAERAQDVTNGFVDVSPETAVAGLRIVESLRSKGGTNLFAGLAVAFDDLAPDRATSVVLVTDGAANLGPTTHAEFRRLLAATDVRVFGFLLGNGANWPLMRTICQASGGFLAGISNDDDLIGQMLLAKSKVAHECMHDVRLEIEGVRTHDVGEQLLGKVYRGQQLVLFGRYELGGPATVTLKTRMTGEDQVYRTAFIFPDVDARNPEIERLFAVDAIERLERQDDAGLLDAEEARAAIRGLGVQYQIVTDHTSMLVLQDRAFEQHGIERANLERTEREHAAQQVRMGEGPQGNRVDGEMPMFRRGAPGTGGGTGNGAFGPVELGVALLLLLGFVMKGRR